MPSAKNYFGLAIPNRSPVSLLFFIYQPFISRVLPSLNPTRSFIISSLTTSFNEATVPFPLVDISASVTSSLIMDSSSRPASELSGGGIPGEQQRQRQRQQRWWRIELFRGMVNDIRRRAPYYWGDWKDAWDYRVVPATVYIYFAK